MVTDIRHRTAPLLSSRRRRAIRPLRPLIHMSLMARISLLNLAALKPVLTEEATTVLDEATCTTVVDVEDSMLAAPEVMVAAVASGARTVVEADFAAEAHLRQSACESTLPKECCANRCLRNVSTKIRECMGDGTNSRGCPGINSERFNFGYELGARYYLEELRRYHLRLFISIRHGKSKHVAACA